MTGRYVVMGVSGCGKSHIGAAFAKTIGVTFVDGDDLHTEASIKKMSQGIPLNDADRTPWLDRVGHRLGPQTVIACSALKRSYRDRIRRCAGAPVVFLYLQGERSTLLDRMNSRPGHFMPADLLDSQLATLEQPSSDELHVIANIEDQPDRIVERFVAATKDLTL